MFPYPKIETLFERDQDFKVTDVLKNPVYNSFKTWSVTEKIDGTNIRVMLSRDGVVTFGGRTDNANLNADLVTYLNKTFTPDKMKALWLEEPVDITLYGEGYGAGIQKGGCYRPDKSFRLFDVLIGKWWLDWENTEDIAKKLEIKTVPYLGEWTLEEIIEKVKLGLPSNTAHEDSGNTCYSEGIVGRTIEPLFDKHGKRIILKLKTSDF